MAAADPEIILETYDKHHVKVPTSIAKRSNTINLMIEGDHFLLSPRFPSICLLWRGLGCLRLYALLPYFEAKEGVMTAHIMEWIGIKGIFCHNFCTCTRAPTYHA